MFCFWVWCSVSHLLPVHLHTCDSSLIKLLLYKYLSSTFYYLMYQIYILYTVGLVTELFWFVVDGHKYMTQTGHIGVVNINRCLLQGWRGNGGGRSQRAEAEGRGQRAVKNGWITGNGDGRGIAG